MKKWLVTFTNGIMVEVEAATWDTLAASPMVSAYDNDDAIVMMAPIATIQCIKLVAAVQEWAPA